METGIRSGEIGFGTQLILFASTDTFTSASMFFELNVASILFLEACSRERFHAADEEQTLGELRCFLETVKSSQSAVQVGENLTAEGEHMTCAFGDSRLRAK